MPGKQIICCDLMQYKAGKFLTKALIRAVPTPKRAEPKNMMQNCQAEFPSTTAAVVLLSMSPVDTLLGNWLSMVLTREAIDKRGKNDQ